MEMVILIGALLLLGAAALVVIGLRAPEPEDPLQTRLAEYAAMGQEVTLEEIELSAPFHERIIYPLARMLGKLALRFTPQNSIQQIRLKLERAGNPGNIDPTLFYAFKILGILLGVGLFIFTLIAPEGNMLEGKGLLYGIPASIFGFYLPDLLLEEQNRPPPEEHPQRHARCPRPADDLR
jgi:tight adherence protein C